MRYPVSVAVTWKKTFDELDPTAGALLRLTAFLAAEPIQIEMFEEGEEIVREAAALLAEETGREQDSLSTPAALSDLAAYSMVTRQDGRRFVVHRMVQEALRHQDPRGGAEGLDWNDLRNREPVHADVAIRLNNLAALLQDTNRLGKAEPLMRRALAIDGEAFGEQHPKRRQRSQQSGFVAPGHERPRRGRAVDAPGR